MINENKHRLYLCHGPNCTARGCTTIRTLIDNALWNAGLLDTVDVIATGCQDHCDYGPNMIVQPDNVRYHGLNGERVAQIVAEHIRNGTLINEFIATPVMRRSPR
jgi:(2Fe-2S) ferredoxin